MTHIHLKYAKEDLKGYPKSTPAFASFAELEKFMVKRKLWHGLKFEEEDGAFDWAISNYFAKCLSKLKKKKYKKRSLQLIWNKYGLKNLLPTVFTRDYPKIKFADIWQMGDGLGSGHYGDTFHCKPQAAYEKALGSNKFGDFLVKKQQHVQHWMPFLSRAIGDFDDLKTGDESELVAKTKIIRASRAIWNEVCVGYEMNVYNPGFETLVDVFEEYVDNKHTIYTVHRLCPGGSVKDAFEAGKKGSKLENWGVPMTFAMLCQLYRLQKGLPCFKKEGAHKDIHWGNFVLTQSVDKFNGEGRVVMIDFGRAAVADKKGWQKTRKENDEKRRKKSKNHDPKMFGHSSNEEKEEKTGPYDTEDLTASLILAKSQTNDVEDLGRMLYNRLHITGQGLQKGKGWQNKAFGKMVDLMVKGKLTVEQALMNSDVFPALKKVTDVLEASFDPLTLARKHKFSKFNAGFSDDEGRRYSGEDWTETTGDCDDFEYDGTQETMDGRYGDDEYEFDRRRPRRHSHGMRGRARRHARRGRDEQRPRSDSGSEERKEMRKLKGVRKELLLQRRELEEKVKAHQAMVDALHTFRGE